MEQDALGAGSNQEGEHLGNVGLGYGKEHLRRCRVGVS